MKHKSILIFLGLAFLFCIGQAIISFSAVSPGLMSLDKNFRPLGYLRDSVDLNGDGHKEYFVFQSLSLERTSISIANTFGEFIGAHPINGRYEGINSVYGADGLIMVLTSMGDSLFINHLGMEGLIRRTFITLLKEDHDPADYAYDFAGTYGDYVFFSINAGYPLIPRAVYRYDISDGSLIRSKDPGSMVKCKEMFDLTGDGVPEILTRAFAPENIHYPVPYTDSSSWLRVFDIDLNHLFEPIEYKHMTSTIVGLPLTTDSANYLAVSHTNRGLPGLETSISLVDQFGDVIWEKRNHENLELIPFQDQLLLFNGKESWIGRLNEELELAEILREDFTMTTKLFSVRDLNGDGRYELITKDYNENGVDLLYDDFKGLINIGVESDLLIFEADEKGQLTALSNEAMLTAAFGQSSGPWKGWTLGGLLSGMMAIGLLVFTKRRAIPEKELNEPQFLIISSSTEDRKIPFDQIVYLQADGNYSKVYYELEGKLEMVQGHSLSKMTLPDRFYRYSRSHVVNLQKIKEIDKTARSSQRSKTRKRIKLVPPAEDITLLIPIENETDLIAAWRNYSP